MHSRFYLKNSSTFHQSFLVITRITKQNFVAVFSRARRTNEGRNSASQHSIPVQDFGNCRAIAAGAGLVTFGRAAVSSLVKTGHVPNADLMDL